MQGGSGINDGKLLGDLRLKDPRRSPSPSSPSRSGSKQRGASFLNETVCRGFGKRKSEGKECLGLFDPSYLDSETIPLIIGGTLRTRF